MEPRGQERRLHQHVCLFAELAQWCLYALVVLFREATAEVPEVATAEVATLRQRLWKVGAVVTTSARRIWFHLSETWPHWNLWERVQAALTRFVERLRQPSHGPPHPIVLLPM